MPRLSLVAAVLLAGCAPQPEAQDAPATADYDSDTFCETVFPEAFVRDYFEIVEATYVEFDYTKGKCAAYWTPGAGTPPEDAYFANSDMDPDATGFYVNFWLRDDAAGAERQFDRRQNVYTGDEWEGRPVSRLGDEATANRELAPTDDPTRLYDPNLHVRKGGVVLVVRHAWPNAWDTGPWRAGQGEEEEARLLAFARSIVARL